MKVRQVCVAGERYCVLGPGNYDALVDDPRVVARFARDEYLPYWAEFWPVALLLADAIAAWGAPAAAGSPRVLELGCGLGIASLVALRWGYDVVASDYDVDALAFVAESARRNGLPDIATRYVDWRERYADLEVDRIVAAEILYETRHLRPVAEFIRAHLRPSGFALICDAKRTTADGFEGIARASGLMVQVRLVSREAGEGVPGVSGRIFELRRQASD